MGMIKKKKVLYRISKEYALEHGLDNSYVGKEIVFYTDRKTHIERHMNDFSSIEAFNSAFINMSSIISDPDFVTYDDKNNSLLFIKKLLDTTLVATRVTFGKEMKVKTMYPINHAKIMRLQKQSKTKIMD